MKILRRILLSNYFLIVMVQVLKEILSHQLKVRETKEKHFEKQKYGTEAV